MNHDFENYAQGFSFDSFLGEKFDASLPYIPETIDCQRCGYCVRSCPTYKVKAEENYSPRGRIRLIERLIRKHEVLNDDELVALNSCTLCRACETVCPSKMDYDGLYRQALEACASQPQKGLALKFMLSIFAERRPSPRFLNALIHIYQKSGLPRLVQGLPSSPQIDGFKQLSALLPVPYVSETVPKHAKALPPVHHGDVVLFTGCVAKVLDTQTHTATIKLLNRLGFSVRTLAQQTCCGAMHAHNGDIERAKALARTNIDAFSQSGASAVLYNASGCGAFLSEYDALLKDEPVDTPPAPPLPIIDILDFLVENARLGELSFQGLKTKVAVHEPCSQRNVLKSQELIYTALAQIPDLDVVALPDNAMCCGAGGTQLVTQPELASPPRDEKVQALLDSEAEILLSTNLTCALHLAQGVRKTGRKIVVMHPVTLLAQQMI
jgi:glycolate oxidase iron-sulfur subunit